MKTATVEQPQIVPIDEEFAVEEPPVWLVKLAGGIRYFALLVAWVAMAGSLFFSDVLLYPPCLLCWYQRILMYPLTVLIAIGILRRDKGLHLYILPFSLIGITTSLYHYLLIKTRWLPPPPCVNGIPCDVDYINWLGFINIPFMALTAFIFISISMIISTVQGTPQVPVTSPLWRRLALVGGIIALVVGSFMAGARMLYL